MLGIAAAPGAAVPADAVLHPAQSTLAGDEGPHAAEALEVLELTGVENPSQELDEIVDSIHLERTTGKESPLPAKICFSRSFWRVSAGAFNQLTGINACLYYLNDIFAAAGASKYSAGMQSVLIGCTNLFFTLIAMTAIDKLGRKKLLLVRHRRAYVSSSRSSASIFAYRHPQSWLIGLLIGFMGFFAISQGAVVWVYISEVFPTRVRAQGQSLGASSLWIMNALISASFPVLAAKSTATPFFFFAVMMFIDVMLVAMLYPEMTGVSLEHLEQRMGLAEE